ncbi:MAG: NAD(P)(+) transhydrogenase (Re/Si-specific) subunit alpha [Coriobacteriia bacterium]|nr:NAD(P)(+) transhydrogenase (Re/Si-specific) subunit alpha [Coriobacteriia bacterium]
MIIGIPREILEREHRVAALPEEVAAYVQMGFEVIVEASAGEATLHSDADYVAAGAQVVAGAKEVFARADIILKVKQPHFNVKVGKHEADMVREGAMLITFLHPAAPANHDIIRTLRDRNVTSLTMDGIVRIPRARPMDALSSMSLVTGYKAVILAAAALPRFIPAIETPMGTTEPAEFLIIGAGVVGMEAIATAKRLGARVKVFDIREGSRKQAEALGAEIVGFEMPQDLVLDEVGSAEALPADWLNREREALKPLVPSADVIILSVLVPGEVAPVLITDKMVASMRPGSVIVDVSVDQGGNCAATVPAEEFVVHGVTVMGYINIPGSVAVHASWLYGKNMLDFVRNLFQNGLETPAWDDEIVRHALVTRDGKIVHEGALHAMGGDA